MGAMEIVFRLTMEILCILGVAGGIFIQDKSFTENLQIYLLLFNSLYLLISRLSMHSCLAYRWL